MIWIGHIFWVLNSKSLEVISDLNYSIIISSSLIVLIVISSSLLQSPWKAQGLGLFLFPQNTSRDIKFLLIKSWLLLVYIEKSPESEDCVDQKTTEREKNESNSNKSEELEKTEEKSDGQGKKDGKNKQCKHKREKEPGEQGKPKTDVQDKDEINSKEREQPECFWDTILIVLHTKLDIAVIGAKPQELVETQ